MLTCPCRTQLGRQECALFVASGSVSNYAVSGIVVSPVGPVVTLCGGEVGDDTKLHCVYLPRFSSRWIAVAISLYVFTIYAVQIMFTLLTNTHDRVEAVVRPWSIEYFTYSSLRESAKFVKGVSGGYQREIERTGCMPLHVGSASFIAHAEIVEPQPEASTQFSLV